MPHAAPSRRATVARLFVLAALVAAALSLHVARSSAHGYDGSGPTLRAGWAKLFAVELGPRQLRKNLLADLRRGGVRGVVLNRWQWSDAAHYSVVLQAQRLGMLVIEPHPSAADPGDRAALTRACHRARLTVRNCALAAKTAGQALKIARTGSVDFVTVHLSSPSAVTRFASLRSDRTRVVAILPWRVTTASSAAWAAAVAQATLDPGTALAITPRSTSMSVLAPYFGLVKSAGAKSTAGGTPLPVPAPVTGLHLAAADTTSITVSWTPTTAAADYGLSVDGSSAGTTTQTTATFANLQCGTSHVLAVTTRDGAGNSSQPATLTASTLSTCGGGGGGGGGGSSSGSGSSGGTSSTTTSGGGGGGGSSSVSTDTVTPSTPSGLGTSSVSQTSATLSWTASTDNVGVAGYTLYLNGARAGTSTATSYAFGGLACGTSYTLGVDAADAAGNHSAVASTPVTTSGCSSTADTTPPAKPTGLTVTGATTTTISLSWNPDTDNVGIAGYRLWRNGVVDGTTTNTAYTYSGLACGTSYTLQLEAFDAAGNTSVKEQATVVQSTSACAPPSGGGGGAAASLWVSPSGSDGNPCSQAAPCLTLNRAYQLASCGSVIAAEPGSYPAQTLSAAPLACTPTTPVVVAPDSGAAPTFTTITVNGPSYLTLQNLNLAGATVYVENLNTTATSCGSSYVTLDHLTANQFEGIGYICHLAVLGGSYVGTDNDSQVGPAATGAPAADTVLIDGVHFGTTESAGYRGHLETLHMWGPGLSNPHTLKNITIQNSTFDPCPQDNGSNSTTGCTNLSSGTDTLTVQNNMLNGGSPNALGLSFDSRNITYQYNSSPSSITWGNTETACTLGPNKCGPWTIRGNYMTVGYGTCAAHVSPGPTGSGSDVATYAYNAWRSDGNGGTTTCSATDSFVASLDFTSTTEGSMNLHLKSTTATAAGKGGSTPCVLATDIDGQPRPMTSVSRCDAGADEAN
jgi:chitodextrinase